MNSGQIEILDKLDEFQAVLTRFGFESRPEEDPSSDSSLHLHLRWSGYPEVVTLYPMANLRSVMLPQLRELQTGSRLVIATSHVSSSLAEQLRASGIQFVDLSGNAYLQSDHWMVYVRGQKRQQPRITDHTLGGPAWQVAFAMLVAPEAQQATVRELARLAGTSRSSVSNAIRALAERHWLHNLGRQGQPLADSLGLWREWEIGYVEQLAPKLHVTHAVSPGLSLHAWLDRFHSELGDAAWLGGELGAAEAVGGLDAESAVLHVADWDAALMRRLRLVPADEGPFTIRSRFGSLGMHPESPTLAQPLLLRAELLRTPDERLDAVRQQLAQWIEEELDGR